MKTMTTLALAGALAASAVATTATTAAAGDGWRHRHHAPPVYGRYYYGPDAGAVAAGAILGLAFGALTAQAFAPAPIYYYAPAPPYPVYIQGNPNAAWCSAQYPSYNPQTNTWADFYGVIHICYGPY